MPRPRKCRRVCSQPRCTSFGPSTLHAGRDIVMSVDEYEAIRLIDYEGLTQEQCAKQMQVARTTAQSIYADARKKLSECIVLGHRMTIHGGDVQFCEARSHTCGHCCGKHTGTPENLLKKEEEVDE